MKTRITCTIIAAALTVTAPLAMAQLHEVNTYVGIGTSSPQSPLEISANESATGQVGGLRVSRADSRGKYLYVGYDLADYAYLQSIQVGVDWKNLILNPLGGNVGIGTTTPQAKLDLAGALITRGPYTGFGSVAPSGSAWHWQIRNDVGGANDDLKLLRYVGGQYAGVALQLNSTNADATFTGRVVVKSIEVRGGADVAELFRSRDSLAPGTLVVADRYQPGQVVESRQACDEGVIGIVSGAGGIHPAQILSQEGTIADGNLPISTVGRVWCKCDASFGAIEPGHLLTTSATAGHAMRATDKSRAQGAIIGKALTPLPNGQGLVLVWITHQ